MKVNINKLMKYPSQAFQDLGAIDLFDDQDIETCTKEVMMINEEADFKELPLDESTEELNPLPSTLKYAFPDSQQAKTNNHFFPLITCYLYIKLHDY